MNPSRIRRASSTSKVAASSLFVFALSLGALACSEADPVVAPDTGKADDPKSTDAPAPNTPQETTPEEKEPSSEKPKTQQSALKAAIAAVGGDAVLKAAATIELSVTGHFYEPHQHGGELDALEEIPASFRYTKSGDAKAGALLLEWEQDYVYPFVYQGAAKFVLQKGQGSVSGVHGFGSRYFGYDAPQPLDSARVAAIEKTQLLLNPLWLLAATEEKEGRFFVDQGPELPPIELFFDADSGLPARASVAESDALLGDVLVTAEYSDWKKWDDVSFPGETKLRLGEHLIREEHTSELKTTVDFSPEHFEFEVEVPPVDTEQARVGQLRSQWYHRMFSFGFSQDFNPSVVEFTELDAGLHLVSGGPALAYVSLVIEEETGLTFIEPNLNAQRSSAVYNALQQKFEKPVTKLLASHTHMDHFGGVRTLLQDGAQLYVGEAGVDFAHSVLDAPHTLFADDFSGSSNDIVVTAVGSPLSLGTGSHEVQLLPFSVNHAEDLLTFYLPGQETLFVADIFNAGFVYGWDAYSPATQAEIHRRAVLLDDFITKQGLEVSQLIGVHGGLAPRSELDQLVAKVPPSM